jgi:hypothetical protein
MEYLYRSKKNLGLTTAPDYNRNNSMIKKIYEAFENPLTAARHINRRCHTRNGRYSFNPNGISIFEEDWDNLIVLDACRYDAFEKHVDLPGQIESRESLGPATYRWVRANFSNKTLHDTVYVAANTWFLKLQNEINAEIYEFIDLQHDVPDVEWLSEELKVITPSTVTKHAKRAADSYPGKRLIVHYLQPHHPFIGPTSERYFGHESDSLLDIVKNADPEVTRKTVWRSYIETLEIVLDEVSSLISKLKGRTVITADHGEMIGERHDYLPVRDYGHHRGIYNKPTVKVPWHIIETGDRKEIRSEEPATSNSAEMEQINDHLEDLGYKL